MHVGMFETPVRFSFPQQQIIDGQAYTSEQLMDAFFIERSQEVYHEVQRAL